MNAGLALDAAAFSAADFRRRAAERGALRDDDDYGDHRFNPGFPPRFERAKLRSAAVLIAVVDHPAQAAMILTKRAETLRSHTGQVSFPGGRIDATDPTPEFAALREAQEEIGLVPETVEIVGRMPDYHSGSGYRVAPVLGIVQPGFALAINHDEVDTAFEVPLHFLMNPENHARNSRRFGDSEHEWMFYEMPYGGQRIWGLTAGIIRTLYERLYA